MKIDRLINIVLGAVLLALIVALTVYNVPNDARLLDVLYLGLAGTGYYHISGDSNDKPPTDKQGGRALPGFLVALAAGSILLTGCMTLPQNATPAQKVQATQLTYTQACAAWGAAFQTALQLRIAGKLNQAQIDQVTLLDSQVTPICTGPLPQDSTLAAQQVTAAVTTLTILEIAKTETKQ